MNSETEIEPVPENAEAPLSPRERLIETGGTLQLLGWIALVVGILGGVVAQVNESGLVWFFCGIGSLGILMHLFAQLIFIRAALEK